MRSMGRRRETQVEGGSRLVPDFTYCLIRRSGWMGSDVGV